ncbi:MAG: hypothetical protein AAF492_12635 [Verrucomicrobiota bacterium]
MSRAYRLKQEGRNEVEDLKSHDPLIQPLAREVAQLRQKIDEQLVLDADFASLVLENENIRKKRHDARQKLEQAERRAEEQQEK